MMFWVFSSLAVLLSLAFIAPALWRTSWSRKPDQHAQNVAFARERLRELEAEHRDGRIGEDAFNKSVSELETNLLDDITGSSPASQKAGANLGRVTFIVLAAVLPLSVYLIYGKLGSPNLVGMGGATSTAAVTAPPMPTKFGDPNLP